MDKDGKLLDSCKQIEDDSSSLDEEDPESTLSDKNFQENTL